MAKYIHPDVLDNGLQHVIDQVGASNVDMLLIDSYSQGQSYAVVNGNSVMSINMVVGDFSLANFGTYGRKLVIGEKSGSASGNATNPDLHVAIVDVTAQKVLAVNDEITDQNVTSGNPITVPTFSVNFAQPT